MSSKIAESNRESAYIVDPVQCAQTHLAEALGLTDTAMSKASADARLNSLEGHKSQKPKPLKEVAVEDLWTNAAVQTDTRGAISDMNVRRSTTQSQTPSLCMSGSSEPNSEVSEGVELDIFDGYELDILDGFELGIFDGKFQPLGHVGANEPYHINGFNNTEDEYGLTVFDATLSFFNSPSRDDLISPSALNDHFTFDTSTYSLDLPPVSQMNSGGSSSGMLSKQKKLNKPRRNRKPYSEDIATPGREAFSTNSSYDSVLSDPSSVQEFNLVDNSSFENVRPPSKGDPIHLASVLCEQKPAAPLRTSSRAPRIFKCWVETCSHFSEGFLTLKERRTHYEKVHSHLILTCRVAGCKASPFLREQDRTRHENRMHSEVSLISLRTSKRPSADDVVEVPNGNTLPSRISQEATLPSGSLTTLEAQRSHSVCSDGSVGFDTDSTWSGEESDWEDDGIDPNELLAQMIQDSEVAVRPLLTPMKRELVDDIMKEFWIIFNQEWSANVRNCSGTPNSGSSSVSPNNGETGNEPNKDNAGQKRQRHNDEGDEDFDGDGKRDPKHPRIESPPDVSQEKRRFACPYRKHDPRTYCHRIRCWRPCALTPLETIARVKCVSSEN